MTDEVLGRLVQAPTRGWGEVGHAEIGGCRVFVKVVPVTDVELAAGLPTTNLYDIPPYLNYPYGSPGVSVGRELAFAQTSTEWVESGACTRFPMLVDHRVVRRTAPRSSGSAAVGSSAYPGGVAAMDRYLADRAAATNDLVMVFEHVPYTATAWLTTHTSDAARIHDQMSEVIGFLGERSIVHFDGDLFNIVTDETDALLADHGLVMDPTFDLNPSERTFLAANSNFDAGNLIMSFGHQLYWMYRARPIDERAAIDHHAGLDGASFESDTARLLDTFAELDDAGLLPIGTAMRDLLERHEATIRFMHEFFTRTRQNWSSDSLIDDVRLGHLLVT